MMQRGMPAMLSGTRIKNLWNHLATAACLIGAALSMAGCSSPGSWSLPNRQSNPPQFAASRTDQYPIRLGQPEMVAQSDSSGARATAVESYHRLAIVSDREGRFQEAESYYKRALAISPTDPNIWNDLGYSYLLQERLQEAELALGRAVALNPKDRRARNNLGLVLGSQGRTEEALNEFRVAGTPEAEAQRNLAMITRSWGRYGTGSAVAPLPNQPDPHSRVAQMSLGNSLGTPSPPILPVSHQDATDGIRWVPYDESQPVGVPAVLSQPANSVGNGSASVISSAPSARSALGRRTLGSTQMSNPAVEATQGVPSLSASRPKVLLTSPSGP